MSEAIAYLSENEIENSGDRVGERFYYNAGDGDWDTDDEVEEANAADDTMRVIERDW